jgi:DUF4097 and DUF4098 domain-containing protein YvlB
MQRHGKRRAIGAVVCILALLVGGGVVVAGFEKVDWNYKALDMNQYVAASVGIDAPFNKINIDITARNITICKTEDANRIEAYNWQQSTLEITNDNGVLYIKENLKPTWLSLGFSGLDYEKTAITIYVNTDLDHLDIKVTSGNININNISANTITAKAVGGAIRSTGTVVSNFDAKVTSGGINLEIRGDKSEYTIESSITSGHSRIDNQTGTTDKKITLKATSGSLKLAFVV